MGIQAPWQDRLTDPMVADHLVQLYGRRRSVATAATCFVGAGLQRGEGAVLVATPVHVSAIDQRLRAQGLAVPELWARGQLRVLDAADTLGRFMVSGWPDAARFRELTSRMIDNARRCSPAGRVRVYGEMVNLLWRRRDVLAAMRLEDLWSDVLVAHQVPLLCGYRVSPGASDFPPSLKLMHQGVIPDSACN